MKSNLFDVRSSRSKSPRAFSLVEMMVVLLILAVILAIVVPALSAARNTARKAASLALMTGLSNASSQFLIDEGRLPGYFTARDMGAAENGMHGFSAMNNILADLSGGVVSTDTTPTTLEVGPLNASRILIDTALIGSARQIKGVTNKAYFQPDPKFFGLVTGKEGDGENPELPDLFDSWGTPILAWQQDEAPNTTGEFAEIDAGAGAAKFYWVQNWAFLDSDGLGKFSINQRTDSWLGTNAGTRTTSMRALLGTPTFADPTDPTLPADARAKLVFQSAGYNSTYCGKGERGGKIANSTGMTIRYTSPADAMESFDDFLVKVGN